MTRCPFRSKRVWNFTSKFSFVFIINFINNENKDVILLDNPHTATASHRHAIPVPIASNNNTDVDQFQNIKAICISKHLTLWIKSKGVVNVLKKNNIVTCLLYNLKVSLIQFFQWFILSSPLTGWEWIAVDFGRERHFSTQWCLGIRRFLDKFWSWTNCKKKKNISDDK